MTDSRVVPYIRPNEVATARVDLSRSSAAVSTSSVVGRSPNLTPRFDNTSWIYLTSSPVLSRSSLSSSIIIPFVSTTARLPACADTSLRAAALLACKRTSGPWMNLILIARYTVHDSCGSPPRLAAQVSTCSGCRFVIVLRRAIRQFRSSNVRPGTFMASRTASIPAWRSCCSLSIN